MILSIISCWEWELQEALRLMSLWVPSPQGHRLLKKLSGTERQGWKFLKGKQNEIGGEGASTSNRIWAAKWIRQRKRKIGKGKEGERGGQEGQHLGQESLFKSWVLPSLRNHVTLVSHITCPNLSFPFYKITKQRTQGKRRCMESTVQRLSIVTCEKGHIEMWYLKRNTEVKNDPK